MKTVFVVDDSDTNLMMAKTALDGVYRTFALPSAAKMLKLAEKITPDLILLDVHMPEMNGFEAMSVLKSDAKLRSIPVVFLSAQNDPESAIHGFALGALDFISKPFSPPVLVKRIETCIETDKLMQQSRQAVRNIHNATISVIANMVEWRGKAAGGHIERTQAYLEILLNELVRSELYADAVSNWDVPLLLPSAQLHDVGKISISEQILSKPGKLSDEEFALVRLHCAEGERICDEILGKTKDDGFLFHAKRFAGYHHERWDGTGYPRGLHGEDIPLEGRLMAIADVYDALVSDRPYKETLTDEEAVRIIMDGAGKQFDPLLAKVFYEVRDQYGAVK